jgi:hypothetical protein
MVLDPRLRSNGTEVVVVKNSMVTGYQPALGNLRALSAVTRHSKPDHRWYRVSPPTETRKFPFPINRSQ